MSDILPPPPPRSSGDGCWKWGAISCLGGCALLLVVGIVAVYLFMNSSLFRHIKETASTTVQAQANMMTIKQALDSFKKDHGKYPDTLQALIPKYLPSERTLKPTLDGSGPVITYAKPPKDAQDSFPILQYEVPNPVQMEGQSVPGIPVRMRLDGQFEGASGRTRTGRPPVEIIQRTDGKDQ